MHNSILPVEPESVQEREGLARFLDWIVGTHIEDAIPGYAGLDLGDTRACFDNRAAELEGLARLLWGAAFAFDERLDSKNIDRLLEGLANGADPTHPSYWGKLDDHDQRAVEMAPIAAALLENPGLIDRLPPTGRENLLDWLASIQDIDIPKNNWRFFRILTQKALERAGRKIDTGMLAADQDFIDSQYRGGGWYGDNLLASRDYYNGFAFQYYSLLYARWFLDEDPERCRTYLLRAREFALRYRYWFDDDGAPIAYGRSLTYRFATAAFWPLLASFGHPHMGIGELRGLWSRSMSWWLKRRIFDARGRITIGFAYPNLLMSESYNSPQSPLWALKAFFPLALPEDHAFWTAAPEPCRYPDATLSDTHGGFVMQRRHGGAYVLAGAPVQMEMRNCADKYGKFAYSSRHGLGVEASRWLASENLGDNVLVFRIDNKFFARESILDSRVMNGELVTAWAPFSGCKVETRQRFTDTGERRTHIVDCDRAVGFVASGHAVDLFTRYCRRVDLPPYGDTPAAVGRTLYSDIADADGKHRRGVVASAANTNLMFPQASVPIVDGELPAGRTVLDTVLSYGTCASTGM